MNAIEIHNLTKIFRLYRSPRDRLREFFSPTRKKYHHEFRALNDVSFEVEKGQTVGIIGQNGSGKSTLLKIICGVVQPTGGTVKVNSRISALLELGTGFNPEFTGRENVYINGALMGFSKEEMDRRFSEIESFAEIGEFIEQPVKKYSSGMLVRLAFSLAINIDPEILIVDEALSVGDGLFQAKCFSKFKKFKDEGITIIFVSHNLGLITAQTNYVLLLNRGVIIDQGKPKKVLDNYNRLIASRGTELLVSDVKRINPEVGREILSSKEKEWQGLFKINPKEDRYGTKKTEILEAGIFTPNNEPVQVLERNKEYLFKMKVSYKEPMPAGILAFIIKDTKGTILCGTNTLNKKIDMGLMKKGEVILITFKQKIRLNPDNYLLCFGSAGFDQGNYVVYDRRYDYMLFEVVSTEKSMGIFDPESDIEWISYK